MSARRRPRVGLFLNVPMREAEGEFTARYPHLLDFYLALADRTAQLSLCVPLHRGGEREPEYGSVPVQSGVHVVGLPYWTSAPVLARRFLLIAPAALWRIIQGLRSWDAVGAVVPSVVGDIFVAVARLRRRPVFLLVRGEKRRTVSWMWGRRALPLVWALAVMEMPVRRWIKAGAPAFVAGDELRLRYPGPRVYDLYPALDRDFPVADQPRAATNGDVLRLVTVARLSVEKGIADLLQAVAMLREQGHAAELVVAGDGPDAERLHALADELKLTDAVRFVGFVPHGAALVDLLDQADVFVLPSRSEGLPHAVVEAMARGLPIVATAIGGLPRLLADGNGIIVNEGAPRELAQSLAALAVDPAERARLSARSVEVAQRYRPAAQMDELCAHLVDAYPQLDLDGRNP